MNALLIRCPACEAEPGRDCWVSDNPALRPFFGRRHEPHTARVMASENPGGGWYFGDSRGTQPEPGETP